jgi:hypothetical protein
MKFDNIANRLCATSSSNFFGYQGSSSVHIEALDVEEVMDMLFPSDTLGYYPDVDLVRV